MYKIGDTATWRGINREYTGVIVGFHGPFAVARMDGSARSVLLYNGKIPGKDYKSKKQ